MSAIEIPGYKIIRTLGVGGQATVYLALQQGFEREVALKVMSPALAADPSFGERFIREAKIVAKLSHKSIVTVYDVGESGNFYYLAMEYMPGEDLKSRIHKGMKTKECLSTIAKIARALHFAHQKGYIHRDVKSENILFDQDDEPVLTDFGIAKASNSSTQMTQTGKLIGTPEYMSPEQCRGKNIDGRTDLYSLGIILFEMLTRKVPFTGEDSVAVCIQHVTKPLPRLPARLNHYQWLIDSLLAKDPNQRIQTGEDLALAIGRFEKTGKTQEITQNIPSSAQSKMTGKRSSNSASLNNDFDDQSFRDNDSFTDSDLSTRQEEPEIIDDLHTEHRYLTQAENRKNNLPLFVGLTALALIGVAAFFTKQQWMPMIEPYLSNAASTDIASTRTEATSANNPVDADKPNQSAPNGVKDKAPDVASLLQEADALVQFVPHKIADMKKALKLISAVNALEKDNKNAQLIYQNILSTSLLEATALAEKEDFVAAEEWISLVKFENPKYALLAATTSNIEQLKQVHSAAENERLSQQTKIDELIQKGQTALNENRLSSPSKDNAIEYFEMVLKLQPDNNLAQQGLLDVTAAYESLVKKAIADESFTKAKALLSRFNNLSNEQPKKIQLRQALSQAEKKYLAEQAKRKEQAALAEKIRQQENARQERLSDPIVQMQLLGNLDSAKSLEAQDVLVMPEENNAVSKYRAVLNIDDRNVEAKAGLTRIENKILSQLQRLITQKNRVEAEQWLTRLKLFQDNHPQFDNLASQVSELPLMTESLIDDEQSAKNPDEQMDTEDAVSEKQLIDKQTVKQTDNLEKSNLEKNNLEQNKTKQDKQDKTEHDKTVHDKTEQSIDSEKNIAPLMDGEKSQTDMLIEQEIQNDAAELEQSLRKSTRSVDKSESKK
ncbi:serine/threonine protein kinase [Aliikangiella maris]|uniref:Protein kinase n=2 Tax=Aliikangiella maris TaxID=3162458 RepID=A0ABV2BNY5_9GAMM